ncbi:MAG: hypothetical protein ABIN04_15225 [Ginsengibacter sp.]
MSKTIKLSALKNQYEFVCTEYVNKFCNKYDFEFDGWVGQQIGGIVNLSDYFFNFSDIVLDIDSKQPKGMILRWYDDNLETQDKWINYYSYTKGLRITDVK